MKNQKNEIKYKNIVIVTEKKIRIFYDLRVNMTIVQYDKALFFYKYTSIVLLF